jgi:hypothetical protein
MVGTPADVEGLSNQKFFDEAGAGLKAPNKCIDNIITPNFHGVDGVEDFRELYLRYRHFFGEHIDYTIPGYEEFMILSGLALCKMLGEDSSILYQGASDGRLGKSITAYGHQIGKRILTKSLTSSITNLHGFSATPNVDGATGVLAAFSENPSEMMDPMRYYDPEKGSYGCLTGYAPVMQSPLPAIPPDGQFHEGIGSWTPDKPFNAVISYVLYQFCGNNRHNQIAVSKRNTTKDCIFLFCEKFNPTQGAEDQWMLREIAKDHWKLQFFSQEEVREKKETVLSKMQTYQVTQPEFETVLRSSFKHAVLFANTANFFSYAACDDLETLQRFMANFPILPHAYTFVQVPQVIC